MIRPSQGLCFLQIAPDRRGGDSPAEVYVLYDSRTHRYWGRGGLQDRAKDAVPYATRRTAVAAMRAMQDNDKTGRWDSLCVRPAVATIDRDNNLHLEALPLYRT